MSAIYGQPTRNSYFRSIPRPSWFSGPVAEFAGRVGQRRGAARTGAGPRYAPVLELRNQPVGESVNTHETLGLWQPQDPTVEEWGRRVGQAGSIRILANR